MGFYRKMEDVQAAGDRGNYTRAGHYLAIINRVRSGESQADNIDYAAVDMTVLHTFDDGDTPMHAPGDNPKEWAEDPQGWHKPGEDIGVLYSSKFKSARPNFKAFIANALGVETDQITGKLCEEIESDDLLGGVVVELKNRMIAKSDGGPFTKVWCMRSVPAVEFAEILDEAVIEKHWPDGGLAEMVAAESEDTDGE